MSPLKQEFTIQTLEYLAKQQKNDGSFRSMESYPNQHPWGNRGWQEHDPSPFIHSNILIALQELDHPLAQAIVQKGIQFILNTKEYKGFWRFWAHGGQTHNVPIDIDDTALCSFLLSHHGYTVDNQKILLQNKDHEGYFLTWILPQHFSWKYFGARSFLKKDLKHIAPTLASPMLDIGDKEPAVAANALLYLGENNQTKACLHSILQQLGNTANIPLQYYQDLLVVYYHIARAYFYGVKSFEDAIPLFEQAYNSKQSPESVFELAMGLKVFQYFNLTHLPKYKQWQDSLLQQISTLEAWLPYIYFVSKDRNFRAGSPELTAAFCLSALAHSEK